MWIDGVRVLSRGPGEWGSWQRFGVHVAVTDGRHRVVARTLTPMTSVRLLNPNGTAADVATDGNPSPPTTVDPPRILADPNPIEPIVRAFASGELVSAADPVVAALAALAAQVDQMTDVAAALVAPLVDPDNAAPLALEMAAQGAVAVAA